MRAMRIHHGRVYEGRMNGKRHAIRYEIEGEGGRRYSDAGECVYGRNK